MLHDGAEATLAGCTPDDVVRWLISKDETGTTVVHAPSCPLWSHASTPRSRPPCPCPSRAAAGSIQTLSGYIQAVFRDAGFDGPFNASTQTGNPANSPQVHNFVKFIGREQAASGSKPLQSAVISLDLFALLTNYCRHQLSSSHEPLSALQACKLARLLLFVTLCWASGLRARDVLRILSHQLSPALDGAPGDLQLLVTVTKCSHDPGGCRFISLTADSGCASVPAALALYRSASSALMLPPVIGYLFAPFIASSPGSVAYSWSDGAISKATLESHFKAILADLGMPSLHITLHSFHGSSSVHDYLSSVPVSDTLRRIGWTFDTWAHYTLNRTPITLASVLPSLPPSLTWLSALHC